MGNKIINTQINKKDIPDFIVIKILQEKIKRLQEQLEISKKDIECFRIDYIKQINNLEKQINNLEKQRDKCGLENKRKTLKIKELRKDNKLLIEKLNKYINNYGEI